MKPPSEHDTVREFVDDLAGDVLHPKQVDSLAHAVTGALHADTPSIAAIGRAAARVRAVSEKHSIKQIDRLLANSKVDALEVMRHVTPVLVAERARIAVTLDWMEFVSDGHSTLVISMVTEDGSTSPLVWTTVLGKRLRTRREQCEARLLRWLRVAVPEHVHLTVLRDRDLSDRKRFGLALAHVTLGAPGRRDRMLLVLALAAMFSASFAGERLGPHRQRHANPTPRNRTRSLLRQARDLVANVARAAIEDVTRTFSRRWNTLHPTDRIHAPL